MHQVKLNIAHAWLNEDADEIDSLRVEKLKVLVSNKDPRGWDARDVTSIMTACMLTYDFANPQFDCLQWIAQDGGMCLMGRFDGVHGDVTSRWEAFTAVIQVIED